MVKKTLCAGLFALLPLAAAHAGTLHYISQLADATWAASATERQCELTHPIAGFGRALFGRRTGSPMYMEVRELRAATGAGQARLSSQPPGWKPGSRDLPLGSVELNPGPIPFHFAGNLVRRTLEELEQGMNPTFTYTQPGSGNRVRVSVSAVNFMDAYEQYLECVRSLAPKYQEIRARKLYFDTDSAELTEEHRQYLDDITEYLWSDVTISEIKIRGFADSRGSIRYNEKLSLRRAARIRDYLVLNKGLPKHKVKVYASGRIKEKGQPQTEEVLRENRRVEMEVLR